MIFHHVDQFLLLAIEVFGYLRKHANAFLHDHANVIWSLKGPKGVPFFCFDYFFYQKISITLQRIQSSSILNWEVAVGLSFS